MANVSQEQFLQTLINLKKWNVTLDWDVGLLKKIEHHRFNVEDKKRN